MSDRYWINYDSNNYRELFPLVDEEFGGEVAYFVSSSYAHKIASLLNIVDELKKDFGHIFRSLSR